LSGFRSGKFMTLVATNVAARGLDINDVQLIIQVLLMLMHANYGSLVNSSRHCMLIFVLDLV
jgi:hypothetical protein